MTSHEDTTIEFLGPAPEWWPDLWPLHQIELRSAIRRVAGTPDGRIGFTRVEYQDLMRAYDPREVVAALVGLVRDGVLVQSGGRYRLVEGSGA